jgi:MoaA/NifB/PqqE/SkfB family radical SAM enzyme
MRTEDFPPGHPDPIEEGMKAVNLARIGCVPMMANLASMARLASQLNSRACLNALLNQAEGILRATCPRSLPVNLDIVLTKACNLRCTFCVSYGALTGQRWMSFDLYQRIARRLFPTALGVFFCSGGEPFLYPRMRDALRLARHHRTLVTVTTNGMLLDSETSAWIVQDQTLHELCISFDGATKATLERIRRGSDYDMILTNIAHLSALKKRRHARYPRLWLRYVVMRSNVEELPDIFEICAKHGLYRVEVKYLNLANEMESDESLFNHRDLAKRFFLAARDRARHFGIELGLPPLPGRDSGGRRCLYPWRFCQIDPDGSVRFCYQCWRQRIGWFSDGFESLWRGERYRRLRETLDGSSPFYPRCAHCAVRCGYDHATSHDQRLLPDSYLIPGIEDLQVPLIPRSEENASAFRQLRSTSRTLEDRRMSEAGPVPRDPDRHTPPPAQRKE